MRMKPGLLLPSLLFLLSLLVARPPPAQLCCQQLPLFLGNLPFPQHIYLSQAGGGGGGASCPAAPACGGLGKGQPSQRDICLFSTEQKEKHFFQQRRLAWAP